MVDNIPWDDADNKAKSLIYLSLGSQATNIFHQRFPHTDLQKCTTDALVEQLKESFTQTRNETFDSFQFFRCQQKEGESLEVFHSRIKKHAALCNWEHLEESLVKSIFIQGMRNQQIQMDLLSEDRTPSETLNYALARERGQANQQKMNNSQKPQHANNPWFEKIQYIKRQQSTNLTNTTNRTNTKLQKVWKQILTRSPKHMPGKERSLQNMQKDRTFRKNVQIRNAATTYIQTTTSTTTKQHRNKHTTKVQPTGTKTNTTKNEKHK